MIHDCQSSTVPFFFLFHILLLPRFLLLSLPSTYPNPIALLGVSISSPIESTSPSLRFFTPPTLAGC